jgi:heme exporter protein C
MLAVVSRLGLRQPPASMTSNVPVKRPYALLLLIIASAVLIEVALFLIGARTPPDRVLGIAQKIFYFHVGSAFAMLLALSCGAVFSLVDLVKQHDKADAIARACIEVGCVFGAMVLTSGPLWARKSWGAYWTWEPRLTLTLLTFLLAISVLAVRGMAPTSLAGRRAGAAMAVMAAPAAYLIHVAVRLWGGNHPQVVQGGGGGIQNAEMRMAFTVSVIAVLSFAVCMVFVRYRGLRLQQAAADLRLRLSAQAVRAARSVSAGAAIATTVAMAFATTVAKASVVGMVLAMPSQAWAEAAAQDLSKYKEESVPGGTLLALAYMVMWAMIAIFMVRTVLAQAKAEAEVRDLSERLELIEEDGAAANTSEPNP